MNRKEKLKYGETVDASISPNSGTISRARESNNYK